MVGEELCVWHLLVRATGSRDPGLAETESLVLGCEEEVAL